MMRVILALLLMMQISCIDKKNHTTLDTVLIITDRKDTIRYDQKSYNDLMDKHPEFLDVPPMDPVHAYEQSDDFETFGSEAGQDHYFILYAHFLKQENGVEKRQKERAQFIELYTNINALFWDLDHGGTYYGHQYNRILGFAEYTLYEVTKDKLNYEKEYDISKSKALFILSLKQLIKDQILIETDSNEAELQLKKIADLNAIIDAIDHDITDVFYLKYAQDFRNKHYKNYSN